MKLAFVVPSVDRDEQLQCCIASIEQSWAKRRDVPVQIFVVLQGGLSSKELQLRFPELTTMIYLDRRGLSAARNAACSRSSADYLIFLDDDAAVREDFIDVLDRSLARSDGSVCAFCGRLIDSRQQVAFSPLFEEMREKDLRRADFQYFMGSGHVVARDLLVKLGGYDERFGVGSGIFNGSEESDFFFRLKAAGEKVRYLPELVFYHPIPVTPPEYVEKYGHSFAAALTKGCLCDPWHVAEYAGIFSLRLFKAWVRLAQKHLLGGDYAAKDRCYHYGSLVRGSYRGVRDYLLIRKDRR